MIYRDAVQELSDILGAAYSPEAPITEDTTLADMGLDSLEVVEAVLLIEDRWPELDEALDDVALSTKVGDIARLIAHA
jgi:acyl carrier protein